jgi:tetratricopeptide (TPR) repeat protein
MRRWILLGILVLAASWEGWTLFHRHREAVQAQRDAVRSAAYNKAMEAFYTQNYVLAEKLITDILPDVERSFSNDRRFAQLLSMLGASYNLDHKEQQAEPILKQALQVYASISPADPVGTERTEATLGLIYLNRGDYASAEPHLSHARSLSEGPPAGPMYERGNILLDLGVLRLMQGRYPEGEELLNSSVEALAPNSAKWAQTDIGNAYYRLGGLYAIQDRYPEAEQEYTKALAIQEKLLGPNSSEVARTLQGLGQAYQEQGDFTNATKFLNRAQEIAQSSAVPGDSSRAGVLLALGEAAQNRGDYLRAESLYKQAIDIEEKTVGPEHLDFALALVYLGCLYRDEPRFDLKQAAPLFERALAIRERALGPDHPTTASTLSDLALAEFYGHKFEVAEHLAERALPIQERAYGLESLEVSTTVNRLGLAQRDLKKFAEAERSLQRALTIREKNLPPNHAWIAVSLDNLASVYLAQGEPEKAGPLIQRAQAIQAQSSAR